MCLIVVCCDIMFVLLCYFFFFFKQKTAYEMRISDWSSDVCSSDLGKARHRRPWQGRPWRVAARDRGRARRRGRGSGGDRGGLSCRRDRRAAQAAPRDRDTGGGGGACGAVGDRSEDSRSGNEGVRTCSRWSASSLPSKKITTTKIEPVQYK